MYHGDFVTVLDELNDNESWRELYGRKSKRLKDMEMILRFFGLHYHLEEYRRPMKDFLNRYMATNRHLDHQDRSELTDIFKRTTATIFEGIGPQAFKPRRAVNAAVLDAVMTGVAARLAEKGEIEDTTALREAYEELMENENFLEAIERAYR